MAEKKKLLILDDDESVKNMLGQVFSADGMEVDLTSSCKDTLRICEEKKPDLLILDYNVDDGIGWDLAKVIRENPEKFGKPHFIAMSGTVDINAMGTREFDDFTPKPFNINALLAKVRKVLSLPS